VLPSLPNTAVATIAASVSISITSIPTLVFLDPTDPLEELRLGVPEVPEHLGPGDPVQQQFFSSLALFVGTLPLVHVDVVAFRFLLEVVPLDRPRNPTAHGRIGPDGDGVFPNLDGAKTDACLVVAAVAGRKIAIVGILRGGTGRVGPCFWVVVVVTFRVVVIVIEIAILIAIVAVVGDRKQVECFFGKESRETLCEFATKAPSKAIVSVFLEQGGKWWRGQFFRVGQKGERPNRLLRFHSAAHNTVLCCIVLDKRTVCFRYDTIRYDSLQCFVFVVVFVFCTRCLVLPGGKRINDM